jgi:ubiquinone/menaquinone biosynthesis C-methylase UbiE
MLGYNKTPVIEMGGRFRNIFSFMNNQEKNIDEAVKKSFGDEWEKFHDFSNEEINKIAGEYFDIVDDSILKDAYVLDVGCGSGRWAKYIAGKSRFVEAVDPSTAVFAADVLLKDVNNVRITQAGIDTIPFEDKSFDFVMSIGVLHHVPDTRDAVKKCAEKVKKGGFLYLYLYYALDNKGFAYKLLYKISNLIRLAVCSLPAKAKHVVCDVLAVIFYMPWILLGRFFKLIGLKKIAASLPLSVYQNKSFYVIRNDSLDRFGTSLEQRFTKKEIQEMMQAAGLNEITFSDKIPYWHVIGRKN